MTIINLIDILVILSIGAVIGGLPIYLTYRSKLKKAADPAIQRRITLLEEVAQHTGKVSHVFSKYVSLVNEIGPNSQRMSHKQQQELEELSNQLVDVYGEISLAEAKLLLLGERRLEMAMKLYTGKMAQFRKAFYPGRYTNKNELTTAKQEVNSLRDQFYSILSQRYDFNYS